MELFSVILQFVGGTFRVQQGFERKGVGLILLISSLDGLLTDDPLCIDVFTVKATHLTRGG